MRLEENRLKRPLAFIWDAEEKLTNFLAQNTEIETCGGSILSQGKEGEKAKNHFLLAVARSCQKQWEITEKDWRGEEKIGN